MGSALSFLTRQKEAGIETDIPVPVEGEQTEEVQGVENTSEEEVAEQTVPEETPESIAEEVEETEEVKAPEEEAKSQEPEVKAEKFDYNAWIEENENALETYLRYKKTDFSAMDPKEAVALKLKRDNPEWTEADVKAELRDKYGVGLERVEIDEDNMTSEEIKEAKEINRLVERGERLLKSDAKVAKEFFEEEKKNIALPELKIPEPDVEGYLNKIIEEEQEKVKQQYESWKKTVDSGIGKLTTVKRTIQFEDNGAPVELTVDYKLSDKQKEQLTEYLHSYTGHPVADKVYLNEDGSVKIDQLAADKAALLYHDKI